MKPMLVEMSQLTFLAEPMISKLKQKFNHFLKEENAATAVEYALLLGLIAVFCISAILSTGDVQKSLWFDTSATIESHIVPN